MPAILEDLEIDSSDMLSNPKAFALRCVDKAAELRKILQGGISVASYTETVKDNSKGKKVPEHIQALINQLYSEIDNLDPEEIPICIDAIKRLASDCDYMLKDKIAIEVTKQNASVLDKRIAHQYHINLKKLYDHFVVTIGIIDKDLAKRLPVIPVLRGNYGGNMVPLKTYLYTFDNEPGEEYWNFYAVVRKLGIQDTVKTYMDFVEYLEANPNCGVTVTEKVL